MAARRVVLGVTGGIAAYKAVEVCRRLVDLGHHVVPVMTDDATRFIGEVTLSALASEPVRRSLWHETDPIPHTRLGQSADVVVVVPATARFLGTYAAGIADGLLTATVLATRAPVVVCPAMHTEMWEHPAVQENLATLRRRGVHVVPPAAGRLAGGDVGEGRLADPADVVAAVQAVLDATTGPGPSGGPARHGVPVDGVPADGVPADGVPADGATADGVAADRATADGVADGALAGRATATADGALSGRTVLVTAGGTREPIDPVRFITNRSSGKQGHAVAEVAAARGAHVVLVTTVDRPAPPGAEVVRVETAAQMADAVLSRASTADVVVMAAAVADFRPATSAPTKISKGDGPPQLVLEPTTDILAELGRRRRPGQVLVGFAAETGDPVPRARQKLLAKAVDLVVANDVAAEGAGFDGDTNAVTIVGQDGSATVVPMTSKVEVANAVISKVVACLAATRGHHGGRP